MSIRRKISILALSLTACLVASLFIVQPVFAGGKAYFGGDATTGVFRWNDDHCEMSASVRVIIKGKGKFTLNLTANKDSGIEVVHNQIINGPMNYTVHLHRIAYGVDGDSTLLEWTLHDKRDRMRAYFAMGPYSCADPDPD
jgi:hypothetical protein